MKKIGEYLLEKKICDASTLDHAIEKQSKLKEQGVFKPLGAILAESIGLEWPDLNRALFQMHCDRIAASPLFRELSPESIKHIVSSSQHLILPAGNIIFKEGDQPESFYLVISGKVVTFTSSAQGEEKIISQFGPGDGFGEIALLTGLQHKNSVKTLTPTSLIVLPQQNFEQLFSQAPDISLALLKGFASRLNRKDEEILKAYENEQAYQQFVSQESDLSLPDLIGQTRTINNLRKKIHAAAETDVPVLVLGEAGTEKLVVAGTIHKNSDRSSAPFLSMDAEDITIEGYGAIPDTEGGSLQLEMAQSSVLFGYERGAFAISQTRGLGLLQICRRGTVVIENVDKLTPGVQQKLHAFLEHGTFETVGGQVPIASSARIIVTSAKDLTQLAGEGLFDAGLMERLQGSVMTVPPIRKRKSDLRLLVDFLIIMECFKTPDRKLIKGISPEAYQRIMEYDWPGNMDELQIVIRRAINLAQGEYLMPEDIFIGIAPPEGKYTINLFQFGRIKTFFKSRFYPAGLQAVTVLVFSLIFLMAFAGSQAPEKNLSLILVWGMWEPLLFISWFLGARIWCSVCPMGAVHDLLNRVGNKKFKVPMLISNYGVYFSALGLGIIIWAEVATNMTYSPMATGFLLLAIVSFAVLAGIFFERRVWCRYLCPLGTLGAVYSGCSLIEWRSNSSICNSTCKDNSCYKGDTITRGCPLYHGPFALHSNQHCILCGRCVKLCPNDSPALNLRIPGHELWAALQPEKMTAIFVPVILGTQIFRGVEHLAPVTELHSGHLPMWLIYAILLAGTTAVSFAYFKISGAIAFGPLKNRTIAKGHLFITAAIPLVFAFEIAYQLKPLLTRLGHFFPTLGRQFGFDWEFLNFAYQSGPIKPWQVVFILCGMFTAVLFQKALSRNHQKESAGERARPFRNLAMLFLGSIYIGLIIVM
jgi:transcriptional regulator with AAA-type ATPase domain/ferredoxin